MTQAAQLNIRNLEEVFSAFNKMSTNLEDSYRDLEKQVTVLNRELATARSARLKDLTAKEQLASKLSTLMDALPGAVLVIDPYNQVIQENPATREILGLSTLGMQWPALLDVDHDITDDLREVTLNNGRRISICSRAIGDSEERIVLLTDVTDNHLLQQQLHRDSKLKDMGEMTGRLAHQIRTPLATAILYLSQLKGENSARPTLVAKIHDRLRHVEQLVSSMLDYIRDGRGQCSTFDLADLLTTLVAEYRPGALNRDGDITFSCATAHTMLQGNPLDMNNALGNLLDNAMTITDQPLVDVTLNQVGDQLQILVSDNGPGIEDHVIGRIFDPFYSSRLDGTGLGLAITQSVIKAHGGDITAVNNDLQGTTFLIRLPMHPAPQNPGGGMWKRQHAPAHRPAAQENDND